MKINLIVAHCKNYGIGLHNELPWHFKCDMKWFRTITSIKNDEFKNPALLMGKNTWNSLPNKPLPKRINYVLSTTLKHECAYTNINDILDDCRKKNVDVLWIIGGSSVYETFVNNDLVDYQYVTIIDKEYTCDTFIQPFYTSEKWELESSHRENEENTDLYFNVYKRVDL